MLLYAGQWDPNTSLLAHRMKELQGRRAYLKNFWYAAGACTVIVPWSRFVGFKKIFCWFCKSVFTSWLHSPAPILLLSSSLHEHTDFHNSYAAVSDKVKVGKAHGVEMCGEKLVLFRGKDGKVWLLLQPDILACQYSQPVLASLLFRLLCQSLYKVTLMLV